MKYVIERLEKRGNSDFRKGAIKAWRRDPGDFDLAARAAAAYAKKSREPMLLVKGNSYMSAVWHIVEESYDVTRLTALPLPEGGLVCALATPEGEIFKVLVRKAE